MTKGVPVMNLPSASTQTTVHAQPSGETDTRLHGRWFLLTRVAWAGIALPLLLPVGEGTFCPTLDALVLAGCDRVLGSGWLFPFPSFQALPPQGCAVSRLCRESAGRTALSLPACVQCGTTTADEVGCLRSLH